MENNLDFYDDLADESPQGSLFHKSWWLETVAQNNYEILAIKKNGKILAAWPLTYKKFAGMKLILLPQLTPKLGIIFAPSQKEKYSEKLSEEIDLETELIKLLPKHCFFKQHFSSEFTNWLPFYWAGYRQTTRYTYVIDDLSDIDKVWDNIRYSTKRKINMAIKHGIKIEHNLGSDKLYELNEKTFKRQKLSVPYSREYLRRIEEACKKRNASKMFFAVDETGQIHAAVYIIYDSKTAYYLIGGGDPSLNKYGAHFLALWEAIKFASKVSQSFDFEGSIHKNIEPVFRGFGGIQKPYMEITKGNFIINTAYEVLKNAWHTGGIISKICIKLFY